MARGRGRGRVGAVASAGGSRGRGRGRTGGGSVSKFLAPHTEAAASKIANAGASAEYNPEIRQDREDAKGSRKREGDLGKWYAQLAADYHGAAGQGAAALKSVEDTTTKQLGEADSRSSADLASLGADDSAFASMISGPKDTAGLAKIAQAAAAASKARVDQASPLASEQADFTARVGAGSASARLQGIEARQGEKSKREKIRSDLAAVRKTKGAARTAGKEKIRESDRSYSTDLKQLALSRREAAAAEQQAAADEALARIKSSQEARQNAIGNRQKQEEIGISRKNAKTSRISAKATAKHYATENKGGLTSAERLSQEEHTGDAMSAAKALLGIKVPKSAKEWSQFETGLIEKLGSSYSSEAASAVAELKKLQKQKASARSSQLHRGLVQGH